MNENDEQASLEFDGPPEPDDLPSRGTLRLMNPTVAHARRSDPPTSHEAAASVTPTLTVRQEAVLAVFALYEVLTDVALLERYEFERLAQVAGRTRTATPLLQQGPSGLRTRRHELVVLGRLVADGTEKVGRRRHTLWRLA